MGNQSKLHLKSSKKNMHLFALSRFILFMATSNMTLHKHLWNILLLVNNFWTEIVFFHLFMIISHILVNRYSGQKGTYNSRVIQDRRKEEVIGEIGKEMKECENSHLVGYHKFLPLLADPPLISLLSYS